MKKSLAILIVVLITLSCIIFTGCGGSIPEGFQYSGTWNAVETVLLGETTAADDVFADGFVLILSEDGSAFLNTDGEEYQATWAETNRGIRLHGDTSMEFLFDNGRLITAFLGMDVYLEKQ